MNKPPKVSAGDAPRGPLSQAARAERQAKALRENLRRRKQQARGRNSEDLSAPVEVANADTLG